jgi:hypothetical protein
VDTTVKELTALIIILADTSTVWWTIVSSGYSLHALEVYITWATLTWCAGNAFPSTSSSGHCQGRNAAGCPHEHRAQLRI